MSDLDAQALDPSRALLAVLQHAAERESTGPWGERIRRIIPIELPPQVHRGVLEDLVRVVDVGHQHQDVSQDLALRLDEVAGRIAQDPLSEPWATPWMIERSS